MSARPIELIIFWAAGSIMRRPVTVGTADCKTATPPSCRSVSLSAPHLICRPTRSSRLRRVGRSGFTLGRADLTPIDRDALTDSAKDDENLKIRSDGSHTPGPDVGIDIVEIVTIRVLHRVGDFGTNEDTAASRSDIPRPCNKLRKCIHLIVKLRVRKGEQFLGKVIKPACSLWQMHTPGFDHARDPSSASNFIGFR